MQDRTERKVRTFSPSLVVKECEERARQSDTRQLLATSVEERELRRLLPLLLDCVRSCCCCCCLVAKPAPLFRSPSLARFLGEREREREKETRVGVRDADNLSELATCFSLSRSPSLAASCDQSLPPTLPLTSNLQRASLAGERERQLLLLPFLPSLQVNRSHASCLSLSLLLIGKEGRWL